MGDIGRCELIYGELIMMSPAGAEHGVVALRVGRYLMDFVDQHALGFVFAAETGFKIKSTPISCAHLTPASSAGRGCRVRSRRVLSTACLTWPSRSCRRATRSAKWRRRLTCGSRTAPPGCRVADPTAQTVVIRRVGQKPATLTIADAIRNEPLLPEFVLPLSKVFKLP